MEVYGNNYTKASLLIFNELFMAQLQTESVYTDSCWK